MVEIADHPEENRRFPDDGVDTPDTRAPLDTMPTGSFSSSNVHSGLYDYGDRRLYMRYLRDGEPDAIYAYFNVPGEVWRGLKNAPSKGRFVNNQIAYEYQYVKAGRGDFPVRSACGDVLRQFVYAP